MGLDLSPGQVNQLSNAIGDLGKAVDSASVASDRQARSLVRATWALAGVTIVLVLVTAASLAPIVLERSPEEQAERDVARCSEQARIMMNQVRRGAPSDRELLGYTMACLKVR